MLSIRRISLREPNTSTLSVSDVRSGVFLLNLVEFHVFDAFENTRGSARTKHKLSQQVKRILERASRDAATQIDGSWSGQGFKLEPKFP
jgi:hypothetical protein